MMKLGAMATISEVIDKPALLREDEPQSYLRRENELEEA